MPVTEVGHSDSWSLPRVHCLPKVWKTWVGIKPAILLEDSDRNTDFSIVLARGGTLGSSETLEQPCGNLKLCGGKAKFNSITRNSKLYLSK